MFLLLISINNGLVFKIDLFGNFSWTPGDIPYNCEVYPCHVYNYIKPLLFFTMLPSNQFSTIHVL